MQSVAQDVKPLYWQNSYHNLSGYYPGFTVYRNRIEYDNRPFMPSGRITVYFKNIVSVDAVGNGILSYKRVVITTMDGDRHEIRTKENHELREIILGLTK